jgi:hypothetical protein
MSLRETLSSFLCRIQRELFPILREEVGPLTVKHQQIATVLEMTRIDALVPRWRSVPGRPLAERAALARAFVAKAVMNLPTTRLLIDQLQTDTMLRHLCGFGRRSEIPSEATFSRAFAEFAEGELASRLHEALIRDTHGDRLVGHVSRDSTAIEAPERPVKVEATMDRDKPKRRRGRPRKGDEQPPAKPPRRIALQAAGMSLEAMLADLPNACGIGAKSNAKGHMTTWIGYKLHIDTVDGDIPVSCVLTSASVHDSQVAIPLAVITTARVTNLYDLMDSAYDVPEIHAHSRSLGHVPIIDVHPRGTPGRKAELAQEAKRQALVGHQLAEDLRYNQRSSAERVNANLKDNHGGTTVRVRGAAKVMCHLMFGILVVAALQIVRLIE